MKKTISSVIILIMFLGGCNSGIDEKRAEISDLKVISDSVNLLTARISFQASRTEGISLVVTPAGSNTADHVPVIQKRTPDNQVRFDILGLKENTSYTYRISDTFGNNATLAEGAFHTAPVPEWMDSFLPAEGHGIHIDGLLLLENRSLPPAIYIIEPATGRLVMARTVPERVAVVKMTWRNTLLSMMCEGQSYRDCNIITETTVAGDTLLHLEKGTLGFDKFLHHDLLMTENGNIVAIFADEVDGLTIDGLIELDRLGNKVWEWDTSGIIEPDFQAYTQPWANSVFEDADGNFIVSFRRISQVWKLRRSDRNVLWRLGKNRLVEPTIALDEEDTFLMQHFAHFISPDRLILLDNGQDQQEFGFADIRPYTRISLFTFGPEQQNITHTEHIDLPGKYFTRVMGSVEYLGDSFLAGSSVPGYVVHIGTHGEILGELKFGDRFYRAERIENFLN